MIAESNLSARYPSSVCDVIPVSMVNVRLHTRRLNSSEKAWMVYNCALKLSFEFRLGFQQQIRWVSEMASQKHFRPEIRCRELQHPDTATRLSGYCPIQCFAHSTSVKCSSKKRVPLVLRCSVFHLKRFDRYPQIRFSHHLFSRCGSNDSAFLGTSAHTVEGIWISCIESTCRLFSEKKHSEASL